MQKQNKKGFTLIELIVVMTVIGILVLLAMPKFMGFTERARLTELKSNAKQIETASERYYMDKNDWPKLSDTYYTSEQIESFAEEIYNETGEIVTLDMNGKYYDIDYNKLQKYVQKPKDGFNYIIQNPVGDVFYLAKPTQLGEERIVKIKEEAQKPNEPTKKIVIEAKKLIGGYTHGIVLKPDGTVWGWGYNEDGRLGLGHNINQLLPTKLNIDNVKQVATGDTFMVAVKNDGTVWTWGVNKFGQLGQGDTLDRNSPVKVNLDNVAQVVAGGHDVLALKNDGTVWGWGYNTAGNLGLGDNEHKYTPQQTQISNVKKLEAGGHHVIAIKEDNSIWVWGKNNYGQLGLGDNTDRNIPTQLNIDNVKSIETGYYHTVILKNDGTVWTFGNNEYGQLGLGDLTNRSIPTKVNVENISQISGGVFSTMILDNSHNLFGAGYNFNLQYGSGENRQSTFINIAVDNVKLIDSAGHHFFIAKEDGTVWSSGSNGSGQLGLGDTVNRTTLNQIQNFNMFK